MQTLNRAEIIGHVGTKEYKDAVPVLNLSIATTERIKKGEDWTEHTEWHRVEIYGRQARALNEIVSKGTLLFVDGAMRTSTFENRDGAKQSKTVIRATSVSVLTPKKKDDENTGRKRG